MGISAVKGPKPKPTDLKLLRGTRSDRVKAAPRTPPRVVRPQPPERFDAATVAEWGRLCDHLESVGLLDAGHGFALAVYCGAYARLLIAEQAIADHGPLLIREFGPDESGITPDPVIKSNPAAAMAAKCEAIMARVLIEFGLTPASSSRVEARTEGPPDAFAEFLKRKPTR